MLGQGCVFALRLGSTAILARILLPEDFGLIAMVVAIIGFAQMFQSAGLSIAIIQSPTLHEDVVTSLFWVLVAFGLALGLLIAATAPALAWFYSEPRLEALTFGLALAFPLGSIAEHSRALLQRRMWFARLVGSEVFAVFCGLSVGIVMALSGAGVWSLVTARVVEPGVLMVATLLMSGWRPTLSFKMSGLSHALSFGAHISAFRLLNYVALNTDKILIGKFAGATPIGNYSKGYDLVMMPLRFFQGPIGRVALTALSRVQDQPTRFRNYYAKFIEITNVLCMPCITLMAVLSGEVTRLVLGPGWDLAGEVVLALSPGVFVESFGLAAVFVLMPLGRPQRLLQWQVISTPVMVGAFVVGLQWGPVGIALAYSLARIGLCLPSLLFAFRGLTIQLWGALWGAVWRPAVAALGAGGCAYAVRQELAGEGLLAVLALVALVHGLAYAAILMVVSKGEIKSLVFDIVSEFRSRSTNSQVAS